MNIYANPLIYLYPLSVIVVAPALKWYCVISIGFFRMCDLHVTVYIIRNLRNRNCGTSEPLHLITIA